MDSKIKNYNKPTHYQEIDAMRGIAVICMTLFHTAFMIQFLFGRVISRGTLFWEAIPIVIGGTFLTLSGLSLYIGAERGKYRNFWLLSKRSGLLLLLGMGLTVGTYIANIGAYVYFGILHCIGLGTFISFYLLQLPRYIQLILGISILSIGMYYKLWAIQVTCWHPMLFWLYPCYCPALGNHLDYYPLLPWIGFMLIGIFLGKTYYTHGKSTFSFNSSSKYAKWLAPICFLGKYSLIIYCIHTPIIFGILYLIY